uniref:Cutinase n=1 Tax=Peronospora matthiolae TaxID=2874970 RepID=A0AAV1TUC0_9STRA
MGKFDMPATLNYALETSGRETLALVGYSQGSTQAFFAFAAKTRPSLDPCPIVRLWDLLPG